MMGFIAQIEAVLSRYPGLVAAIGSPLVLLLAGKLFLLLYSLFKLRRVHQITSADDPALGKVEDIQRARFPIEERDPEGLLAQKIAASNFDMMKQPGSDAAMIVLYYKVGHEIVAYLTAEHFRAARVIFFWYIAKRDEAPNARASKSVQAGQEPADSEMATHMVRKLLRVCQKNGGWDHVIAEVDSRDPHEAVMRLRKFQQYARQLRYSYFDHPVRWLVQRSPLRWLFKQGKVPPSVFKVDMPFKMPLHEAGFIFEAQRHETPAWLIVAPKKNEAVEEVGDQHFMPQEQVVALLDALRRSYEDPEEPEYSAYIAAFYDKIAKSVRDPSRLIFRLSEVEARRPALRSARSAALRRPDPA